MGQLRLRADFFTAVFFFAAVFLAAPFATPVFVARFFFGGTSTPARRASLSPMAIACLGFLTFARPPDLSWPRLYSCITFPTFARPVRFAAVFFFAATSFPPSGSISIKGNYLVTKLGEIVRRVC
jgi:hypothetical protein